MESAWNQHGIMLWCLLLAALWVNEHCTCLCCEQADRGQYCATHDVPWQLWYAAIGAIGCRWSWRIFLVFDGFCSLPTYMFHLCVLFWSWLATLKLLAVDFLVVLKLDMSSKAFKARTSLDAKDWAPRYTETLYETVLARSLPHSCRLNLFYLNLPLKDAERLSRSVKSISRHK